jgi:hypothetical protein
MDLSTAFTTLVQIAGSGILATAALAFWVVR